MESTFKYFAKLRSETEDENFNGTGDANEDVWVQHFGEESCQICKASGMVSGSLSRVLFSIFIIVQLFSVCSVNHQ